MSKHGNASSSEVSAESGNDRPELSKQVEGLVPDLKSAIEDSKQQPAEAPPSPDQSEEATKKPSSRLQAKIERIMNYYFKSMRKSGEKA